MRTTLIIYNGATGIGGMETLLLRIAKYIAGRGERVVCIVREAAPVQDLWRNLELLSCGTEFRRLINICVAKRVLSKAGIRRVDSVIALDQTSAIIGAVIAWIFRGDNCVSFASNWVPNYFWQIEHSPWHPMSVLQRWNLLRNYSRETTWMMMRKYIDDGKQIFGNSWNATLVPVPVEYESFSKLERKPVSGSIVSIGRIADMKEYNLYMLDIVRELLDGGMDIKWDVYGSGSLEEEMKRRIERLGLRGAVRMHGEISYEQCKEIYCKAQLFVGMGTSILEAAAAGIPGVLAIAYDKSGRTHGTIYDVTFGNLGEFEKGRPIKSVSSEIVRILAMTAEEYNDECVRVKLAALNYDASSVLDYVVLGRQGRKVPKTSTFFVLVLILYDRVRAGFERIIKAVDRKKG